MTSATVGGGGSTTGIEVRRCKGLAEFERCMEIQRIVWACADIDMLPITFLVATDESGGQILGAFDHAAGGRMIGFSLALVGFRGEGHYLHSFMIAVVPEYQNRGIGRLLKLSQREHALEQHIDVVEWAFDPLDIRNAHFNLVRLGAIARKFLSNFYGITTSPLHGGMPTDRLLAEWWLATPRVRACVGQARGNSAVQLAEVVRIRVPKELAEWKNTDREKAKRMQEEIRGEFQQWLSRGYAAAGLEMNNEGGSYLLVPFDKVPGLTRGPL